MINTDDEESFQNVSSFIRLLHLSFNNSLESDGHGY